MQDFKLSLLSISFLSFIYGGNVVASVDTEKTSHFITSQTSEWFSDLRKNVITHIPEKGSKTAEWDRLVSNEYQKITGERLRLAEADKEQDHGYVYGTYIDRIFGDGSQDKDIKKSESFKKIEQLYKLATYAKDPDTSKNRSIDFILKDDFGRGRPYQVLDKNGEYKDNYTSIKGSSFPSGHTFNGFRQAATLAILFPEKADEIFDRAIEYGESRVIVGAHFGTDTIASRVANYYTLAQLLSNDETARTFVDLAKDVRANVEQSCGNAVKDCLVHSSKSNNEEAGYYKKKDPEIAPMLTADQIPETSSALLRLRFPYLKQEQMREILASTAYPSNSLAGWNYEKGNSNSTWGLINLPKAYNGPTNFTSDFEVHQDKENLAYDMGGFTSFDIWKNNIDGVGGLVKKGDGTLVLSGNNTFDRVNVESGRLMLTGINDYKAVSNVKGGSLAISGELNSGLGVGNGGVLELLDGKVNAQTTIDRDGLIIGNGLIKSAEINQGGSISPGELAIGKIKIADNISFEKGSSYLVNIGNTGQSDVIESGNTVTLNGGQVKISLENTKNLLSESEVRSLVGSQYKILTAQNGIQGKFDAVEPNYVFFGTALDYSDNKIANNDIPIKRSLANSINSQNSTNVAHEVNLKIVRNDRTMSSVASTANNRQVAEAIDGLNIGNPILESVMLSPNLGEVNSAFKALSGQIHADVVSNQLSSSRYLRDAGLNRLQLSTTANNEAEKAVWANYLHSEQKALHDENATGYEASIDGFFLGGETSVINDQTKIGLMGGYTRSSLDGYKSTAKSDNFHLGIYGGTQIDNLTLKAGYGFTLHDIDTQRSVAYMNQSDQNKASYKAHTNQFFSEAGYALQFNAVSLEPFVNLSYVNFNSKRAKESGGAASLEIKNQNNDLTTSTMGVHLANKLKLSENSAMTLKGTLGWQHHYGNLNSDANLSFSGGRSFDIGAVPFTRDGAVVNLSSEIALKNNVSVSLGYNGLISKNYKDNSVKANLTWLF